jgi:hypothetical protein
MKGSSEVGTFDVKPPYLTGKGVTTVSVLPSASSHKRHKSSAYDVYDYDQRIIYL